MRAEPGGDSAAGAGGDQLLGPDRVMEVVAALAAELDRVLEAEEAELGGAVVELARELPRLFPLVLVGDDLLGHPAADRRAQLLVLVGERRHDRPLAAVLDHRHRATLLGLGAMLAGFKDFITRGNVVELAVAVVVGTAFGVLVASLVADLLTPLVGAIIGEPDFSGLTFTINDSQFFYGNFINALIAFISVSAAVYFFVVVPMNKIKERTPQDPTVKDCPECLSEIPAAARRCMNCTSPLA